MSETGSVEERFIVVRDHTKRAKVCRGRHGGGYSLVAVCEPGSMPTAEKLVEMLNANDEMRKLVPDNG